MRSQFFDGRVLHDHPCQSVFKVPASEEQRFLYLNSRQVKKGSCWRVHPHIDLCSDQVLKIYLSLTKKKRQHCVHNETKSHKTCLLLVL